MNPTHPPTPSTPGAATRVLSSVAEELGVDIGWVVEEGACLAEWGWDDRFVVDWEGKTPPPGEDSWDGGCYWNIGLEQDWPTVEIDSEMAERILWLARHHYLRPVKK